MSRQLIENCLVMGGPMLTANTRIMASRQSDYFGAGWNAVESRGRWISGNSGKLAFRIKPEVPLHLHLHCSGFSPCDDPARIRIFLNKRLRAACALDAVARLEFPLNKGATKENWILSESSMTAEVEIEVLNPRRPKDYIAGSGDERELGFFLLDFDVAPSAGGEFEIENILFRLENWLPGGAIFMRPILDKRKDVLKQLVGSPRRKAMKFLVWAWIEGIGSDLELANRWRELLEGLNSLHSEILDNSCGYTALIEAISLLREEVAEKAFTYENARKWLTDWFLSTGAGELGLAHGANGRLMLDPAALACSSVMRGQFPGNFIYAIQPPDGGWDESGIIQDSLPELADAAECEEGAKEDLQTLAKKIMQNIAFGKRLRP